jgi:hypothetical protein
MPGMKLSRSSVDRLAALAGAYREAFEAVQGLLRSTTTWTQPPWVFAIDRLSDDDLEHLPAALRDAERLRRRTRAALGSFAELVALEDDGEHGPAGAPESADQADKRRLDRFITVTSHARTQGCSYVNGTFEPMVRADAPDPADTFDFPPRVDET